jgi:predicted  nucleic acid-binding Zn-ribbon protein
MEMSKEEKIEALLDEFKQNNPNRNSLLHEIFLKEKTDEQLDELIEDEVERMNDFAYSN